MKQKMQHEMQTKMATIIALFLFIIGLSMIIVESDGIDHYWIDESPGPTYVEYTRTPLQIAGLWIFYIVIDGGVALAIYAIVHPDI